MTSVQPPTWFYMHITHDLYCTLALGFSALFVVFLFNKSVSFFKRRALYRFIDFYMDNECLNDCPVVIE